MKIVYMGTPDFAVPALEKIVEAGWEVPLVVTKADRPAGRGNKMQQCDVKKRAIELGLPVESPEKVKNNKELEEKLREIAPDFMVVAAYGKILPVSILEIPKYGCINIHGSLLPKYRGAAPIQRSVLAGDAVTGVTIMYMAEECDAGDIISTAEIQLAGKTSEQAFDELSILGADLLIETLPKIMDGTASRIPQDPAMATHAAMVEKSEAVMDWSRTAEQLLAHVLGMYSWPIAFTYYNGEVMKIHKAELGSTKKNAAPGTVIASGKEGIEVACGEGSLVLKTIQMPGKKAMDAAAFLLGHKVETGTVLG